ncbi:MAG: efflux RND transporter periplasmic adaptor subunit [Thermoanaerobaculia bacterium]
MKKLGIVLTVSLALGAALWWWVAHRNGAQDAGKYRTEVADRGTVAMTVTATGTLSAVTTVQVGSQVSGIIAALHADFNTPVQKGQLVAELDPAPFEATVAQRRADVTQAEVRLRNAKIGFGRQERLLADQLVAQSDYDQARADYETAAAALGQSQAALEQAETNLAYTKIRSPIDGVVVDRQYDVGQTVAASFQAPTLFTVAQDLTKMQLQADVDQSDIGRVKVGQKAKFTVDAYPDDNFTATITQVRLNATVNQNVVTYPVILEVDNTDLKLRPKMTADISVEVDRVRDALRVPNAALRFRPAEESASGRSGVASAGTRGAGGATEAGAARARDGAGGGLARAAEGLPGGGEKGERGWQSVYRLAANGKLERVRVRSGLSDGRFTQIVEGELAEGDTVVVALATTKAGESTTQTPFAGGRRF